MFGRQSGEIVARNPAVITAGWARGPLHSWACLILFLDLSLSLFLYQLLPHFKLLFSLLILASVTLPGLYYSPPDIQRTISSIRRQTNHFKMDGLDPSTLCIYHASSRLACFLCFQKGLLFYTNSLH